jgi:hypothetical protein
MTMRPLTFQRLTFRRGDVTAARFGPGDAVVYSAAWDGAPSALFSTQPGNREARPLGLPTGRILAISAAGEMAILLGALLGFGRMSADHELTAARACGISLYRLAMPVMARGCSMLCVTCSASWRWRA